jgi:hypothetical protein
MQALQWAAGTASTTDYGGDTSWQHPVDDPLCGLRAVHRRDPAILGFRSI